MQGLGLVMGQHIQGLVMGQHIQCCVAQLSSEHKSCLHFLYFLDGSLNLIIPSFVVLSRFNDFMLKHKKKRMWDSIPLDFPFLSSYVSEI